MNLYFAPLEGITTYTYRNTHAELFGGCDLYFSPFITPTTSEKVGTRSFRDILPQNNKGTSVCPQLLSNDADAFLGFCEKIGALGYSEANLNLGCPSSTVVKKDRGAGFLRDVDALDRFLDKVFAKSGLEISIKTRIGFSSADEFDNLLEVFAKYPSKHLTVHPRTREDYYNGSPDLCTFEKAYNTKKFNLNFNGNVFSAQDFAQISAKFPQLDGVMLGRGAIKNPAIFREIRGGAPLKTAELLKFSACLAERYMEVLGSEVYTLHKLKEMWMYIMWNFEGEKKILKAIKKSNSLAALNAAIGCLPEL